MSPSLRRFEMLHLTGLLASAVLLLWLARDGTLDWKVARFFFDAAAEAFPLRNLPILSVWGHDRLKQVLVAVWLVAIVLAIAGRWSPALRPWRQPLVLFLVMVAGAQLLVSFIKLTSPHSCPWYLAEFGGEGQWSPLFGTVTGNPGPGKCWPGGHASGGFSLIAGYFALRPWHRVGARWALAIGLGLGFVMSAVQVARGAHFVSHNLWSLWLVWAACFFTGAAWQRMRP